MLLAIYLIICVLIILSIETMIGWSVHLSMAKEATNERKWTSHLGFKKQLNKYFDRMYFDESFKKSIFGFPTLERDHVVRIHAGIYEFDGVGFLINNPISYALTLLYIKNTIKKLKSISEHDMFKRKIIYCNDVELYHEKILTYFNGDLETFNKLHSVFHSILKLKELEVVRNILINNFEIHLDYSSVGSIYLEPKSIESVFEFVNECCTLRISRNEIT